MRKNKNKFLETKIENKNFDAFNVISVLLFFGVLVTFIVCLIDYSIIYAKAQNKEIYQLLIRIGALLLTFVPLFMEKVLKLRVTFTVSTCYYVFLFLGVFLGTFNGVFNRLDIFSYAMNGLSGFILALFALVFINHIFVKKQKQVSAMFLILFCVAVAVLLAVCWEIYEYFGDLIFDMNMQNYQGAVANGALADTMTDLFACLIGATLSAIMSAVLYHKNNGYLNAFCIHKIYKTKKQKKHNKQDFFETIE